MKTLILAATLFTAGTALAQQTVPPGNSAPERDARGIAVVSDPATAPPGVNGPVPTGPLVAPATDQRAAFATQPSTGEKPPCSRTITDNCTQTYERRARPRG